MGGLASSHVPLISLPLRLSGGNVIKLRGLKQKSPLLFDEQRTFDLGIYQYGLAFMILLFL